MVAKLFEAQLQLPSRVTSHVPMVYSLFWLLFWDQEN